MNYLAHLALAQPNHHSLVGNLLGDFCKGVPLNSLPTTILAGLANHRAVDSFTDQHPLVRQSRLLFSAQRRRFAGIALDVQAAFGITAARVAGAAKWHINADEPADMRERETAGPWRSSDHDPLVVGLQLRGR